MNCLVTLILFPFLVLAELVKNSRGGGRRRKF